MATVLASQISKRVVSHEPELVDVLGDGPDCARIELDKELAQTQVVGQAALERPPRAWPAR